MHCQLLALPADIMRFAVCLIHSFSYGHLEGHFAFIKWGWPLGHASSLKPYSVFLRPQGSLKANTNVKCAR